MLLKLLNYNKFSYLFSVFSLILLTSSLAYSKDLKEFKRAFKNGKPLIESKKVPGLDKVFNITTYYDNDKVMKTEQWKDGKRNGITKVFNKDGSLLKEVKFKDNYVLDYKGYKNGRLETQISEDRRTIINKGRRLNIRWNKYYEIWGGDIIVSFDSKALVNYLLNFVVPEEATEILSDITDHFDNLPGSGQNGNDDMVTCGNGTSLFKDNGIDLRNAGSSGSASSSNMGGKFSKGINTSKGKTSSGNFSASSSTMTSTITQLLNTCSNNYRSSVGGTGGLGNNRQRQNDINKARGALDQTIAGCNSRKGGFRSLFSADPTTMFKSLQVLETLQAAEGAASATQVTSSILTETASAGGSAIANETLKMTALEATEGAAVRSATGTAVRGFIQVGLSNAIAGVVTAAVVGWIAGTAINESAVGEALTEAIAKWQEDNDEAYQKAKKEADEAQKAAEARAAAKAEEQKKQEAKKGEAPASTPTTSIPVPDDIGAGDACERAARFKAYCDRTNWKDMRCENFIRMVNGCVGDIREIYVSPEGGNVMSVGCPSAGDPASLKDMECRRRGMFGISGGDGPNGICANKNIQPPLGGPDQNVINPSRGDFSLMNLPGKNVSLATDSDAANLLKSKKPTLIVFADPECGYCNDLGNTLKSKNVNATLANYDVKIVDVNMNPKLANQYGVTVIPSYFVAKDGKKNDLQAGSLGEKEMLNYLNENKNGPKTNSNNK